MNTYSKLCPNVFLAKCPEKQEKGSTILVETRRGKENECIVFNLIYKKDDHYFYSIVRADGFNVQEWTKRKAEKHENAATRAENKSNDYYKKSNKDRDFLSLGEPIKVGHHSEGRHRKIIAQANNNMGKCVEFSDKAETYKRKAEFWNNKTGIINLSMPESIDFFQFKMEEATKQHQGMKNGTIERAHSFSLTYAKKEVNDNTSKFKLAKRLWE